MVSLKFENLKQWKVAKKNKNKTQQNWTKQNKGT